MSIYALRSEYRVGYLLVKVSFLYLIFGVALSAYSEYAVNFTLQRLQTSVMLLGWLSTAVLGLVFNAHPGLADAKLTRVSTWLFVVSVAATLVALWAYLLGNPGLAPLVVVGYIVILIAVILLTIAAYGERLR